MAKAGAEDGGQDQTERATECFLAVQQKPRDCIRTIDSIKYLAWNSI